MSIDFTYGVYYNKKCKYVVNTTKIIKNEKAESKQKADKKR